MGSRTGRAALLHPLGREQQGRFCLPYVQSPSKKGFQFVGVGGFATKISLGDTLGGRTTILYRAKTHAKREGLRCVPHMRPTSSGSHNLCRMALWPSVGYRLVEWVSRNMHETGGGGFPALHSTALSTGTLTVVLCDSGPLVTDTRW